MEGHPAARITPGTAREIGPVNALIVKLLGLASGGEAPHIFTTLARHRGLFRRWLWFAGGLMPGGRLPREDTELVILRTAHNSGCDYEWAHHERIAQGAGLSAEEVARVRVGADASGWSERRSLLLAATDALHRSRVIDGELWARLRGELDDRQLIELCMLVGHYEMLAMTLNSIGVEPDVHAEGTHAARLLRGAILRRGS